MGRGKCGVWSAEHGNVPRPLIDSKVCALNNFSVAAPKTFADCLAPLSLPPSLSPSLIILNEQVARRHPGHPGQAPRT